MTATVRDTRPPPVVVRSLNIVLRSLLRSPLGRFVDALVLLEFEGRRSGRRYRIPVGSHETSAGRVVFTPAAWRANFTSGAPVLVHHRGRSQRMQGVLVDDAETTAQAIDHVLGSGASTRFLALDVTPGHHITAAEVDELGWAELRLTPLMDDEAYQVVPG
ncbi:MAG: hypothetical protein ABIP36_09115 [Acidimicrobiales bacterium]